MALPADETKKAISKSLMGQLNPFYGKSHTSESLDKIINSKSLGQIYIYNSLNELLVIFPSVNTLSTAIRANSSSINKVINNKQLFRVPYGRRTPAVRPRLVI